MNNSNFRRLLGALMIVAPLAFVTFFSALQMTFEYPAILREPTDYVLEHFQAGGSTLIATWYGMVFAAILLLVITSTLPRVLSLAESPFVTMASTFGVVAGVVQILGLIRWPFLVPYLAETYLAPAASPATRESVAVVFQAFNHYAGVAVGEHLGYLLTSLWTLAVASLMLQSPMFRPWLGWIGVGAAVAIGVGVFEPLGVSAASAINGIGYTVWALWLMGAGIFLLRADTQPLPQQMAPARS